MNLKIRSFAKAGDIANERMILKAIRDLDVGDYAVLRSGIGTNREIPTSGRKTAYWFPNVNVKAGDLVVLYTKVGTRSTKVIEGQHTAHFFYWGREDTLWGDGQFGAALLEVSDWQFLVPS
jgi:hypothetical protein